VTPYTHNWRLQAITALPPSYTLYSTPLHTHYGSQSSLVVSWQRVYYSLTVTSNKEWSHFHSLIPFLPLFCNCRLNSIPLLPIKQSGVSKLDSSLNGLVAPVVFKVTPRHGPRRKERLLLKRSVYRAVAWQRKLLDCYLHVSWRGNIFTESLPNNERLYWSRYTGFRASCHSMFWVRTAP
jgi:hypothetical protein